MTTPPGRLDHQVQIRLTTAERDEVERIANDRYEGRMSTVLRTALRQFLDRIRREEQERAA